MKVVETKRRQPMVSVEALAERLGVSVRYVRRLVAERRIEYVKVGHFIRFEADEVERWVESQRVGRIGR